MAMGGMPNKSLRPVAVVDRGDDAERRIRPEFGN
jgi:hypothetical protein